MILGTSKLRVDESLSRVHNHFLSRRQTMVTIPCLNDGSMLVGRRVGEIPTRAPVSCNLLLTGILSGMCSKNCANVRGHTIHGAPVTNRGKVQNCNGQRSLQDIRSSLLKSKKYIQNK